MSCTCKVRDSLNRMLEKQRKILSHIFPEKSGRYFICGEGGAKDEMGLPETILVCPTYGLDGFAVYRKVTDYSAPGY